MLFRAALVSAIIGAATIGAAPPADASPGCPEGPDYTASSGDCVPRPVAAPSQPPGATARCADGTWSFSEHPHSGGTCHGHGGVSQYL
ncbi:DUF3761 domain-containing protein [Mycobacterium sp. pR1184]|uniref:DUF3761 domain-containing protein n=1 Tax=Mycobacterium sp. pR1184 TaxID=3238981 RepID=UPI00351AFAAA